MSYNQDDKPLLTPLVIGLTRSPTLWGVPYMAVIVIIGTTTISWLAVTSMWTLLIAPASYAVLFGLCAWDSKFLEILQVSLTKTAPTPNKAWWGCNSYGT